MLSIQLIGTKGDVCWMAIWISHSWKQGLTRTKQQACLGLHWALSTPGCMNHTSSQKSFRREHLKNITLFKRFLFFFSYGLLTHGSEKPVNTVSWAASATHHRRVESSASWGKEQWPRPFLALHHCKESQKKLKSFLEMRKITLKYDFLGLVPCDNTSPYGRLKTPIRWE